jgi:hypothetical protein
MPPFTPKMGDLVIIKGGIVGRILRLQVTGQWRPRDDQRKGRVVLETWYPIEGWRLVPFAHILDRAAQGSRMSSAG